LLAGELSSDERTEMDAHLLSCSSCWQAVQEDRAGRLALEQLRQPAPPGLADRVRLAVELAAAEIAQPAVAGADARRLSNRRHLSLVSLVADHSTASPPAPVRRTRRLVALVAAACLLVTALTGGLVAAFGTGSAPRTRTGPTDPTVVTALVAMAGSGVGSPAKLAAAHRSEHMRIGGQNMVLRAFRVEGVLAVVATSSRPFAMPSASRVVTGSSSRVWMATRGPVGLYCMNGGPGRSSMLLAAAMPAVQLSAVAARLHLT
jgi:hypothetical protein